VTARESQETSSTPRRRVLISGGAGFIGANLVRSALNQGLGVTVLDNLSEGCHRYLDDLPVQFVEGDVLDSDLVEGILPGHDSVVHLAAEPGVPRSLENPLGNLDINVRGTVGLLELCRNMSKPCRFVFASSNAALGRQTPPASEDKAPLPTSPYGAAKLAGEAYCQAYHGSWGLQTVALRFGNVYGPWSSHKDSVVTRFFRNVRSGAGITIDGDGLQTRDFIYVEDLCRAILLALESSCTGEIFQIATGIETSVLDLAAIVQRTMGCSVDMSHGPARTGDIRRNYSAVRKAAELLRSAPRKFARK